LQRPRRSLRLLQHAIDPAAHAETFFEGFQMNVGSTAADRIGNDALYQPDDRSVAFVRGCGGEAGRLLGVRCPRRGQLPAVGTIEGLADVGSRGQHGTDGRAAGENQPVNQVQRVGVSEGNQQFPAFPRERHHGMLQRECAGQTGQGFRGNGPVTQFDPIQAELSGDRTAERGTLGRIGWPSRASGQQAALMGDVNQGIFGGSHVVWQPPLVRPGT
jgi:hypothetical protein